MSTTTKNYQILQKQSNGDTLLLHPETDASVVNVNVENWEEFPTLENLLNAMGGAIDYNQHRIDGCVTSEDKGAANGVASLDSNGKVPSTQLPSYVDDVVEYAAKSSFPATGEAGKIYVDKTTNLTWRWSGSAYVEISPSLALGETSSTAYAGNKGAALASTVSEMQKDIVRNESNITKITNGTTAAAKAKALDHTVDVYIDSDTLVGSDEASDFSGTEMHLNVELRTTGVTAGTYSCVSVDAYGRATAGAQIVEVGTTGQTTPSSTLAIGGIFFKEI